MLGGSGSDTYLVDNTGDRVEELKGHGNDTVRASVTFTLSADAENLQLLGTSALNGTGNALANSLTGNVSANNLKGAGGNDTLQGLGGNDILTGGAGADRFVFLSQSDSLPGTGRDVVYDFAAGVDKIVLTAIDANAALPGDQAFVLDTNSSFSTGEIRQTVTTSGLLLEANTDADTGSEMAILLRGVTGPLTASDFEL